MGCEPTGNGAPLGSDGSDPDLEARVAALEAEFTALSLEVGTLLEASGPPLVYTVQTTDDSLQSLRVATLAAPGQAVHWRADIRGDQSTGERGTRFNYWADASRNNVGIGGLFSGQIGPNGFTDLNGGGLPPWSTIAVPAGWSPIVDLVNISGNDVRYQFAGAIGQTINWRIVFWRILLGGAT